MFPDYTVPAPTGTTTGHKNKEGATRPPLLKVSVNLSILVVPIFRRRPVPVGNQKLTTLGEGAEIADGVDPVSVGEVALLEEIPGE